MRRYFLCSFVVVACMIDATAVQAVDYFWNNANGGAFDEPSHWTPFTPPAMQGPGGANDTTNFDLGVDASNRYVVTDAGRENAQLIVHDDALEITLFISHTLSNTGGADASLVVGAASGDVGDLLLSGGGVSMLATDVTRIGNSADSTGRLTVRGLEWNGGNLRVGYGGSGTLTIQTDADVNSTNASIGHLADSIGQAHVAGVWNTTGNFLVGRAGFGLLTITADAVMNSNDVTLGDLASSYGQPIVDGTWSIADTLTVGNNGGALINIQDGGAISSGDAFVARLAGSSGQVNVLQGAHWTVNGRLSIGGDADTGLSGDNGVVRIDGHTTVTEDIVLFPTADLELDGGSLSAAAITEQMFGSFNWIAGSLFVDHYNGNLINQDGVLATRPTSNSIAVAGEYSQGPGGVLSLEIAGDAASGQYDSLTVGNSAFLGGVLEVRLADQFQPDAGEMYTIVDAFHLGNGSFSNVANGQRLVTADGRGSFIVNYGMTSPFDPNQVVLSDFQSSLTADFDNDGDVDGDDLAQWQGDFGVNDLSDADDDGDSDGADLLAWQRQLGSGGTPVGSLSTAIPEPRTFAMLTSIAASGALMRRRYIGLSGRPSVG